MGQKSSMFNDERLMNNSTLNRGAKIALWGSAISTLGDALQTIGGVISIEESLISDAEQQREFDKLQSQIDELKKEQSQKNMNIDSDMLDKLVGKLIEQLDRDTKGSDSKE